VYEGALERGEAFYIVAMVGSFLMAATFLKLGHAAFFGKAAEENARLKEAPWSMVLPMAAMAVGCIVFGVLNSLPIRQLIQPVLGEGRLVGRDFSGMPSNTLLVVITAGVIVAAILHHLWGVKTNGSGLKALDGIHSAPFLSKLYDCAQQRGFDPYELGMKLVGGFATLCWRIDRAIDWLFSVFSVKFAYAISAPIRRMQNGNHSAYIAWSVAGLALVTAAFVLAR
jgi:NADH-quinone oxidoreductase subunit L